MDTGGARVIKTARICCALVGFLLLAAMLLALAFGPAPVRAGASGRELAVLASPVGWLLDRTVLMRIAAMGFSAWGVVVWLRCTDRRARGILATIAALLVMWMIVVIIKWKTRTGALAVALWYAYYIPMAFIPVACAALGAHVAGLDRTRRQKSLIASALAISLAFVVIVFTDNIHQLFFTFDTPTAGMLGEYSYGPAYGAFLVWSVVCYAAFFGCMGYAARRRLRLLLAPVAGICLVGIAYAVAYVLRFEPVLHINFSLAYALLVTSALELSLDLGLLPSAVSFTRIFDALPLELSVVSRAGRPFRSTAAARPLSRESRTCLAACDHPERPGSVAVTWTDPTDPDLQLHSWPVLGGRAVLAQSIEGLNAERAELKRRALELARQSAMLERDCQIAEFAGGLASERHLVDEVERALASTLTEVSRSLDNLKAAPTGDSAARDLRRRELERVRMLVAYCKRKGGLVLAAEGDPELDRERLRLIANELAGDLRAVGMDCAAVVDIDHPLSAREMSVIYDCIYDFAFAAFEGASPILMYHLGELPDGCCELRAILQTDDAVDLSRCGQAAALRRLLENRDVLFSLSGDVGFLRLVLRVRGGGDAS